MKMKVYLTTGASVLALAAVAAVGTGASAHQIYYPYRPGAVHTAPTAELRHIGAYEKPYVAPKKSKTGTWADLSGALPFANGPWNPKQMTDGTILVLDYCTASGQWYKLTPDKKGQYSDGTWSKIATMPSGYSPLFFASQVLPDTGNFIVNGGEYNAPTGSCDGDWTNKGALYNYTANTWSTVTAPSGWASIGDAESIVLPDGSYMLADCCDEANAIATISGTTVTWTTTGTGKADDDDEEGWTNLPEAQGGDVFDVDTWKLNATGDNYELYNPTKGTWTSQGYTPDILTETSTRELGPAPLTPAYGSEGTIVQFSANTTKGVNDIYDVASNKFTSGPVMTDNGTVYDVADGPAATEPNGKILVDASPGTFDYPSHFWEWTINKKGKISIAMTSDNKTSSSTSSFEGNLMVIPTGQIIWDNSQTTPNEVALYTPVGKAKKAWLPVVSSVSATLKAGSTGNAISGTNFNGFDMGGSYGDDAQESTNWPLVRITNTKSGDVCFGRSYDFSTMGVWTTGTTSAEFDLPKKGCDTGASTLQVIVNGIASAGTSVTISK
ncbi:MAG TPA: hypothetical protein VHX61_18130 [Rhizomicrobium sp.]|jgi:hypothetical protein|nr:hypothetical protein [Rhizomicrobium sp.]